MANAILILDFGSQYTQLIARRVRELNVYCEIHPFHHLPDDLSTFKAVILSGSPFSTLEVDSPDPDLSQLLGKIPLLAICYGAQYLAKNRGGNVSRSEHREYGRANMSHVQKTSRLLPGVSLDSCVWMSHETPSHPCRKAQ